MNILYSTGCPKCKVLIKKLELAKIPYEICEDTEIIKEKGITSVPVFETKGKKLSFKEAIDYINLKIKN